MLKRVVEVKEGVERLTSWAPQFSYNFHVEEGMHFSHFLVSTYVDYVKYSSGGKYTIERLVESLICLFLL